MAIVGSATVTLRALTTKLQDDIKKGFDSSIADIKKSGASAGRGFLDGFHNSTSNDDSTKHVFKDTDSKSRQHGGRAGALFGVAFTRGAARVAQSGEKFFAKAGGSSGSKFGSAFSGALGKGGGGSNMFMSMGLRIMALVPIFGALIGAVSSLVTGLFSIGAAAASASQSLFALVGVLGAVVQGGIVSMVAFSGIGKALTAGMQSAAASTGKAAEDMKEKARDAAEAVRDAMEGLRDAQENAAENIADALKAIADAKQNLSDTYRDAAQAEKDAIQQVRDAEEALADQHDAVREAQEALTQARIDAKERLIDLQFAEEGGALAERRAAMELSDARWELNAASELPPDNRLRQEAQLAYEEADLNLRMIKERNGDNAEELKKVKKEGINGMDEVVSAQQQLQDAQDGVRDAVQDVNDALRNQRQVHVDNARAIADAQDALAEAQENLSDVREDGAESIRDAKEALRDALAAQREANAGMAAGSEEALKYQEELNKLSPPARRFVEYLVSIKDKLKGLKTAAQAGLFPGLQSALETLVNGPLFPTVRRMMFRTGKAVGNAAQSIAKDLSSGPFVKSFGDVTDQNAGVLRRLGKVAGDLARAFFAVWDAAGPLINRFTKWLVQWADGVRQTTELKNRTGDLTKTFNRAGDRMKVIIDIVKNLWEGFRDVGKIGDDSGMKLLRTFRRSTKAFADFTDKAKNRKMLREFFDATTENFIALSSLIKEVGGAFLRMGADPHIGKLAKQLEPTVKKIEDLMTGMTDRSGGKLIKFINSLIDAFDAISKSGALNVFLDVFTGFFKVVSGLLNMPVVGDFLKLLLKISAAMFAFGLIGKIPGLAKFGKLLLNVGKILFWIGRIFVMTFGWPVALIIGLVAAFIYLYKNVEWFRKRVDSALQRWGDRFKWLYHEIIKPVFDAIVGAAEWVWDKLFGHSIFPDMEKAFHSVFDRIGKIVDGLRHAFHVVVDWLSNNWPTILAILTGPVGLATLFIVRHKDQIVRVFKALKDWVVGRFKQAWKGLRLIFTDPVQAAKNILMNLLGPERAGSIIHWFKAAKDYVVGKFKRAWKGLQLIFTDPVQAAKNILMNLLGPNRAGSIIKWFKDAWDWIDTTFTRNWKTIDYIIHHPIELAKAAIKGLIGPGSPMRKMFWDFVEAVVNILDGIRSAAATPINFVINTVYNDGIRKALNLLPGVDLKEAQPVKWAMGTAQVLPGYSPGRDIHRFYSTTGGILDLSGGEAIMRPEFTRAIGGPEAVNRLNKLARTGRLKQQEGFASGGVWRQSFASGGVMSNPSKKVFMDGRAISAIAAAQIKLAEEISKTNLFLLQGGFGGNNVAASGSSHDYPGVADVSPASIYLEKVMRQVGFAAWARNIPGRYQVGSGEHIHAVSFLDPGNKGHDQFSSWASGTTGLEGDDPDPAPHYSWIPNLMERLGATNLKGIGGADAGPSPREKQHDKWWDIVTDLPKMIKGVWDDVKSMVSKGGEWWTMFSKVARSVLNDAVDWANDKIPNRFLPDNPIGHFDRGGVATGLGYLPKRTPMPERVLSPRQTLAFERLVDILDRRGGVGGNNITVHVPHEASAGDVVNGIVYELRRMERGGRYAR